MRKLYIGSSVPNKFKLFGALVLWYCKVGSHIFIKFEDELTEQEMIFESSRGEAHRMTLENWYKKNKMRELYEFTIEEELYRAIMVRCNNLLQTSYSVKNIFGTPLYDLGELLGSKFLKKVAIFFFSDGKSGVICSEAATFILQVFGIVFKRPNDFVKPDQVVYKLRDAAKTEDYIRRVRI